MERQDFKKQKNIWMMICSGMAISLLLHLSLRFRNVHTISLESRPILMFAKETPPVNNISGFMDWS